MHFIKRKQFNVTNVASHRFQIFLFFFCWARCYDPLLIGRTRSRGRCWIHVRLSHRLEPIGHAVHGEVDGLDIGGQHERRFVLLRHTHQRQRRPYPIYTRKRGYVRHRCGGGWAGPTLVLETSFRECGCRCRGWKWGVFRVDQPPRISSVIPPVRYTYVIVVCWNDVLLCGGSNRCLDLICRAFALGGQVSTEWS